MLNVSESIIIGVVSGIITSFVIWLLITIFRTVAVPWYQNMVYRGVKIDGYWIGFWEKLTSGSAEARKTTHDPDNPDIQISLIQKGHTITGEVTVLRNIGGTRDPKTALARGVFQDGNLILTYQAKDQRRLGTGSFVLKLMHDGKELQGKCLFISSVYGQVADHGVHWQRKSE